MLQTSTSGDMSHSPDGNDEEEEMSLKETYARMWRILKLKPVQQLGLILLTCRLAFSCADNITVLKLIEKGFPKETMAMLVVFMFPFDLLFPIFVGRWSNKGNALWPWVCGYPFRLFATLLGVALVATFPDIHGDASLLSFGFYARVLCVQLLYSMASNILFVAQCAFFAQVCDESIGGSYMTLLNTISNLGSSWPKFFVFAAVDLFTCKATTTSSASSNVIVMNGTTAINATVGNLSLLSTGPTSAPPISISTLMPDSTVESDAGVTDPSSCSIFGGLLSLPGGTDGYYIVSFVCFMIGVAWFMMCKRRVLRLGQTEKKKWSCQ